MDSNPIICGDGPAGDQVPFVRVYLDRDTGRAVIALDRAAKHIAQAVRRPDPGARAGVRRE